MFIRPSTALLSVAALAGAVAAAPNALEVRQSSQCDTGSVLCCESVQSPTSAPVKKLAGSLGIDLSGITADVGISCSPITSIGVGDSCTERPACCTGKSFDGAIVLGCSLIKTL